MICSRLLTNKLKLLIILSYAGKFSMIESSIGFFCIIMSNKSTKDIVNIYNSIKRSTTAHDLTYSVLFLVVPGIPQEYAGNPIYFSYISPRIG